MENRTEICIIGNAGLGSTLVRTMHYENDSVEIIRAEQNGVDVFDPVKKSFAIHNYRTMDSTYITTIDTGQKKDRKQNNRKRTNYRKKRSR